MCAIMGYCSEDLSEEVFRSYLQRTSSRGPDDTKVVDTGKGFLGFQRLENMGLTDKGIQPFVLHVTVKSTGFKSFADL